MPEDAGREVFQPISPIKCKVQKNHLVLMGFSVPAINTYLIKWINNTGVGGRPGAKAQDPLLSRAILLLLSHFPSGLPSSCWLKGKLTPFSQCCRNSSWRLFVSPWSNKDFSLSLSLCAQRPVPSPTPSPCHWVCPDLAYFPFWLLSGTASRSGLEGALAMA